MATLVPGFVVPSDIISLVCQYLERKHDLSNVSLVSRAWYNFAFPHLHRQMWIKSLHHLELLMNRLEAETPTTHTRLSLCLRSLVFIYSVDEVEWDFPAGEFGSMWRFLQRLRPCATKLENLEHISWSSADESAAHLLEIFWKSCPRLHMVSLMAWAHKYQSLGYIQNAYKVYRNPDTKAIDIWLPQPDTLDYYRVSARHALIYTHDIRIDSGLGDTQPSGIPSALLKAIDRCPDLVELELLCSSTWRPTEFLRALTNPFSKLTRLAIGGDCQVDWSELMSTSPTKFSLRSFFESHPGLREVDLSCIFVYQPGLTFTPETMQHLFPSLTSFAGTVAMCGAVVSSSLAGQLEYLTVFHEPGNDTSSIGTLADLAKPLPKLKALGFLDDPRIDRDASSRNLDLCSLDKMLAATPALRELGPDHFEVKPVRRSSLIGAAFDYNLTQKRLLLPLKRTSMLKEITIRSDSYLLNELPVGDPFIGDLIKTCPFLARLTITQRPKGNRSRRLYIHRSLDGSLRLRVEQYGPIGIPDEDL